MSKRVIGFRFQPLQAEFDPGKDSHIVIHASRANLDPEQQKALIDLAAAAKVKVALWRESRRPSLASSGGGTVGRVVKRMSPSQNRMFVMG
jgi:hypothetical protein